MYYPTYQNFACGRYYQPQKKVSFGQLVNGAEKAVDGAVDVGVKTLYAGAAGGCLGILGSVGKSCCDIGKGGFIKGPWAFIKSPFKLLNWGWKGAAIGLLAGFGYNMYKHFYPDSMKYSGQQNGMYC